MILEFSVKNFLSFKERITFSMLANGNSVLEENYVEKDKTKILKTAAIYGANASGKTNLFSILADITSMLKNSNNNDINSNLPIVPFKFDNEAKNKPSEFEIRFIIDNIKYVYGFTADYQTIYEEYLYYYPNGKETKIFYRENINDYSFTARETKALKELVSKNAHNKFFLATATNWNYEKTKSAYDFLTNYLAICFNAEELKSMAFDMYNNDTTGKLKEFALDFLKKADFNIIDYKVMKIDIPNELLTSFPEHLRNKLSEKYKTYRVLVRHKGSNEDSLLDLSEESLGTQMIFAFIPFISEAISGKKILIVDELDRSLHPFLVHHVVEIFNNPEINKSGSQLIFNTHDTNLLNLNILRRDQIWFTEKNSETGESDLYPLSDFSVRKKENIEKGYLLGRYGAVPFITNDINLWQEE